MKAANVACRELGFAEAFKIVYHDSDNVQGFALGNIVCNGSEARLIECDHSDLGLSGCGKKKYAGVVCNTGK